jgi:hypothetical protein
MEMQKQGLVKWVITLRILLNGLILEQSLKFHIMIHNMDPNSIHRQVQGNKDIKKFVFIVYLLYKAIVVNVILLEIMMKIQRCFKQ